MARVEVPLIGDLAILQGETYQALSLTFPGDLSTWTPRGQIRSKLLEESGTLLAEFSFEASTYDADADTTTVNPRLTPTQTASLPKTKWQGIGEYSKAAVYYYDIELESDTGEVVKSKTAIVQVVGEVTGGNDSIPTPPIVWDGAIDHISLTSTNGLIKTYTAWGDELETINLGSFEVEDGNGITETNYSALTGVLTITYSDGSTFSTGDIRGEQGIQGIQGEQGLSAYEVAVADGFVGTEAQWIESLKADLDATTIKARYESNPNTNAFTDAEKTALGTALQPSALNNYETTTQLNARDAANRLWTNLTSVPTWIVNATAFGQSLVTAASASAVKTLLSLTKADVGLSNVDNTSDVNKPISITTQSALDLKANLNNPQFTGTNLILPNNSRINGVEHFYQATKPITRGDGSPLVIGDRWYKSDEGSNWFWNGTYWLSPSIVVAIPSSGNNGDLAEQIFSAAGTSAGASQNALSLRDNKNLFVHDLTLSFTLSTASVGNHWAYSFVGRVTGASPTTLYSATLNAPITALNTVRYDINSYVNTTNSNVRFYNLLTKTGSPSNLSVRTIFSYSIVHV